MAAALMLLSVFAGMGAGVGEVDGDTGYYWTDTISPGGQVTGSGYDRSGDSIASNPTGIGPGSTTGSYQSTSDTNIGSWGFDDAGYGPFGSFYAAFDPNDGNRMICHLNPDNLKEPVGQPGVTSLTVDGSTVNISDCNIMWCLPTVYWKTDGSGNLILTNNPSVGGSAYAHTIDGTVYPFLAIGVYEGSKTTINGTNILASLSGGTPLVSQTRATIRDLANNQSVNTDGQNGNGKAMLWNFYQYELYKYCALAVMGSWDSQSVAGNGSVYGTSSSVYYDTPGLLDASGPYAGTLGSGTENQQNPVKVFIENAWGSVDDFVDGVVINGTSGFYVDTSSVPTDATSEGGNVTYISATLPSSGWATTPSTDVRLWGFPAATGGDSLSGLYDYIY